MRFDITYEKITPESAAEGESAESGFHLEGVSLREAFDELRGADCAEANEFPIRRPDWITFYQVNENFATGETVNMALHFPRHMTPASRIRVCRLFRVYGMEKRAA